MTIDEALRQLIVNDHEAALEEFRQSFGYDHDRYLAWLLEHVELTDEERTVFEGLTEGQVYFLETKYVIEKFKANEAELQRQIRESGDRLMSQIRTKNDENV